MTGSSEVPRADRPGEQWRSVEILRNKFMRLHVRSGDRAEHLRIRTAAIPERRHRPGFAIRWLLRKSGPVYRASVEPWRRAGLEPCHRQICAAQLVGETNSRCLADPTARHALLPAEQPGPEKSPGAKNHGAGGKLRAVTEFQADNPLSLEPQSRSLALDQGQVALLAKQRLDGSLEQCPVRLHARPPDSAPLGAVEHAIMNGGSIRRPRDQSIESIDLAHQMALTQAADRGVATHGSDCTKVEAHEPDAGTHSSRYRRSLATGVPSADDQDVECPHSSPLREGACCG